MYNNRLAMKDIFMNEKLSKVFPQFKQNEPLRNVYSFAQTDARVLEYLKNALNGRITAGNELLVKGNHRIILSRVTRLKSVMEKFFNNTPSVVKQLRRNVKLYTPFTSIQEIADIKSTPQKIIMMKEVLNNLKYNPDIVGLSGKKSQENWMKKVGYKEKK